MKVLSSRPTPWSSFPRQRPGFSRAGWRLTTAGFLASATLCSASTSYGSLNNFDVVNDTGGSCHGFEIELEDLQSTDITYTYDYNHYGTPRLIEDRSDPDHPRVKVRYESKVGSDGEFLAFTKPQDPLHPLAPTDGHAFTDPTINLGGEHFGVGFVRNPSTVRYHWLVADPVTPGTLIQGPPVYISTPAFAYVPPIPGGGLAQLEARMEPPEEEHEKPADQFGIPVWVKVTKTVQHTGRKIRLEELVTDDPRKEGREDWTGDEEAETEVEWRLFQKRPARKADGEDLEANDDLPNGDETVTRRYEFYTYLGTTNPEDGEADCEDPADCPDAVGAYIGSQMAGFNVETPLGLIDHLQDGSFTEEYVPRSVVIGGNTPYAVRVSTGELPPGLQLNETTGVLTGHPTVSGTFNFTLVARDADAVEVTHSFTLAIPVPLTASLTGNQLRLTWDGGAGILLERSTSLTEPAWLEVPGSLGSSVIDLSVNGESAFFRVARP